MPSIQALERKNKKLQKEYTLTGEELKRLRYACAIECVDALDEAHLYGGHDSLCKYLPDTLPENVYCILTSRPELKKDEITSFDSTVFECYTLPPLIQTDIEVYLTQRVPSFVEVKQGEFSAIAALIYEKSEGNPLYLYHLMQECDGENLTLEQIYQLPQGLEQFYERQWKDRIWTGDRATKEGRKQLLILLLLLKEPASEEMLLELTDFDRAYFADYLTPLRRFMRTGERYELFHDSFKNFLQKQFKKAILPYHETLSERLRNWQDFEGDLLNYTITWLPIHLLEAERYTTLFALARDKTFLQTQMRIFPEYPFLPLRTQQTALKGAIAQDDPVKMGMFCLAHARQLLKITQESPLDALRAGNLQRAWELADLFEVEHCTLWHLLLAWELKDTGKIEKAQMTMERLEEKELLRLSEGHTEWQGEYAADLLINVVEVDQETCLALQSRLLGDKERRTLCQLLITRGHLTTAFATAQRINEVGYRARVLGNIAQAQAQAGEREVARATLVAALESTQQIEDTVNQAWALESISVAQAQAGDVTVALETAQRIDLMGARARTLASIAAVQAQTAKREAARATFAVALETAQRIEDVGDRITALSSIAEAQAQVGEDAAALETAQRIDLMGARARTLASIAAVQAQAGEREAAQVTFATALEIVQRSGMARDRASDLGNIATAQAQAGEVVAALETVRQIEGTESWSETLRSIAEAQAQAGEIASALEISHRIDEAGDRAMALATIAQTQVQAGFGEQAVRIAEAILTNRNNHLLKIAEALVEVGDKEHFKRLLIPCASYLNAAYHMCGLLAQLYPEQATALAQVVMGENGEKLQKR